MWRELSYPATSRHIPPPAMKILKIMRARVLVLWFLVPYFFFCGSAVLRWVLSSSVYHASSTRRSRTLFPVGPVMMVSPKASNKGKESNFASAR